MFRNKQGYLYIGLGYNYKLKSYIIQKGNKKFKNIKIINWNWSNSLHFGVNHSKVYVEIYIFFIKIYLESLSK